MEFNIGDKVVIKKRDNELGEYFTPFYLLNKTFTIIETVLNWDGTSIAYLVFNEYPDTMFVSGEFKKVGTKLDIFKKGNYELLGRL